MGDGDFFLDEERGLGTIRKEKKVYGVNGQFIPPKTCIKISLT